MKTFEEHYADACYKQDCKERAMIKRINDRKLTREERREKSKITTTFITFICFIILALLIFLSVFLNIFNESEEESEEVNIETSLPVEESQEKVQILSERLPGDDIPATERCYLTEEEVEQAENEMIEAALLARSNKIDNVTITFYCCEKYPHICGTGTGITASGCMVTPYVSCAVDESVIPLGSTVMLEYNGEIVYLRADDTGSWVKGNHIDIAVPTHEEAEQLGTKTATIWWCEE